MRRLAQLVPSAAIGDAHRALARVSAYRFARVLIREVADDDVPGMAAEMAYRFLFAIFPLLLLSAAVLGLLAGPLGRDRLVIDVIDRMTALLPSGVAAFIESTVRELIAGRPGTYAAIGLVATVWGAAGGVGALIKGLNRAYDVERPRPTWRRQLIAIGATLAVPPLGLALLALSVLGHSLAGWLGALLRIGDDIGAVAAGAQALIGGLVFLAAMSVVYRLLPAVRQSAREVLPGAIVATAGWTALTQAFGTYVGNVDRYSTTYGAFAAPIAFLLWLYLVGLVVLIGAEVNALLSHRGRPAWADPRDQI
jgi:membrane protein